MADWRGIVLETDHEVVEAKPLSLSQEKPTKAQSNWLRRGLKEPGGKLPLFDNQGQKVSERTVESCLKKGWVEPWYHNPLKPNWIICKLTEVGKKVAETN